MGRKFLLSFGLLRVQKKGLNFKVCWETSTPHGLHHYRRYFGRKHTLGEAPGSGSTVWNHRESLKANFSVSLQFLKPLFFYITPLTGSAHLNRNSPFSSNYRPLVFLQAQLCLWIQNVIHRVFLTACFRYFLIVLNLFLLHSDWYSSAETTKKENQKNERSQETSPKSGIISAWGTEGRVWGHGGGSERKASDLMFWPLSTN